MAKGGAGFFPKGAAGFPGMAGGLPTILRVPGVGLAMAVVGGVVGEGDGLEVGGNGLGGVCWVVVAVPEGDSSLVGG